MPPANNADHDRGGTTSAFGTLLRLLRWLITAAALLGVLAYAGAAAVTVADIVGRQLGLPIVGVIDLVQLCVIAGAWFVIPYAFLVGAHVGVDLLVEKFPPPWRRALRAFASLVAVALLAVMLVECFATYQQKVMFGDRSQQLGIPITWYWLPLLTGMGLSIVAAVLTLFDPPSESRHP